MELYLNGFLFYIECDSNTWLILQVGDIDFYPNGGIASMPGCEGEPIDIQCSHARKEVS